ADPRFPPRLPFPTRRSSDLAATVADGGPPLRDGAADAQRPGGPHLPGLRGPVHAVPPGGFRGPAGPLGDPGRILLELAHPGVAADRKSTRLNSSHEWISYAG